MLGYTLEELRHLSILQLHPTKDLPFLLGEFQMQLTQEKSLSHDVPVKRKDGTIFHADVNSFPVTLSGRSCMIGLFRDTSERRAAQESLRESEHRFRSVVEQSSEGIVLLDGEGNIIEWNKAQEEMTGRSRREALGRPAVEVCCHDNKNPPLPGLDCDWAVMPQWSCCGRHRRPGHASGWARAARLFSSQCT